MPNDHLRVMIDEPQKLITFRFKGSPDSAACVDTMIETFTALDSPWTYSQLFDYRKLTGLLQGRDLERLSQYWKSVHVPEGAVVKVAILTTDALIQARAGQFGDLFPAAIIRVMADHFDALDWLYAKKADAA